jgi:diamine N-acetyltransferase
MPRLEVVTSENVGSACRLQILPEQERYVAPVAYSLADAYVQPEFAWSRLIFEGEQLVGFVIAGFKPGDPLLDSTIWRLNVLARRSGVGTVGSQSKRLPGRRNDGRAPFLRLLTSKGKVPPEIFYRRLGFEPTGRRIGEIFEAVVTVEKLLVP